MSSPFRRALWRALNPRRRPDARLDFPAALGANDAELARVARTTALPDPAEYQALALLYGGIRR